MFFDLPVEQLREFRPQRTEPEDFDAFWQRTLTDTCQHPLNAVFEPVETGLTLIETYDVTFSGYGGQCVKGWLNLPKQREGALPCIVEFIGYGGGRGFPFEWLGWSAAGYAHFVMDTRGQGSTWRKGDTPDPEPDGANPYHPGFMTRGILDPNTYYYRRVFTDTVRAIETARSHAAVDASKIIVTGGSQGGGMTLAAAALVPDVFAMMPDVPFLCLYRTATEITNCDPYGEIVRYCKIHRDKIETVFQTLSYFDGVNFAARTKCPALYSVGLMDDICPPRTVFAAYNYHAGPKEICIYPYNNHEGGESFHQREKFRFARQALQGK